MAMSVPSRFACLKIEDDDYRPHNPNKEKNGNKKKQANNKSESKKQAKGNGNAKNNQQKTNQQPKKKKADKSAEQWEQWKQKDNVLVEECYEDDLQQALLLSKLEFEEKKHLNKQLKKSNDLIIRSDSTDGKEMKKQKNKAKAMSLDQFNNLMSGNVIERNSSSPEKDTEEKIDDDKEFFSRLQMETKEELSKEHLRETVQVRQPPTTEVITSAQYHEHLNQKDEEIKKMRAELEEMKAELMDVKIRNKRLCAILGQGEMREKAEVLIDVERLTRVQAELTAEVQSLHAQLEQEKSKKHYSNDKDHKAKDKRKRDNGVSKTAD